MKVAELRNLCERMQLDVPNGRIKQPYIDAVKKWQQEHRINNQEQADLKASNLDGVITCLVLPRHACLKRRCIPIPTVQAIALQFIA